MLLDFKVKNFRSFKEETDFTMIPSHKKAHSDYIIKRMTSQGKEVRALPASILYGANASGKSNIMLAMNVLKNIVQSGTIDEKQSNGLVKGLTGMPFIHDSSYFKPMEFEITFYRNKTIFRYGLSVAAAESDKKKFISSEYLYIDGRKVYSRNENQVEVEDVLKNGTDQEFCMRLMENINRNLDREQLFLSGGFKVNFSKTVYDQIQGFFDTFLVIMNASEVNFLDNWLNQSGQDSVFMENQNIARIFKYAEFGSQKVKFVQEKDNKDPVMVSVYDLPVREDSLRTENVESGDLVVNSGEMESKGTIQLLNLAWPFIETLKKGGVLVLDEMDASLHFEIVVSILRMFNNMEINKSGAQIIFNTHNPIYLDGELLRHDQILMVKKSKSDLSSEIYSLVDYELKPEEKILKNYLNGKYGALPHMDLEIAFKSILDESVQEGMNQ